MRQWLRTRLAVLRWGAHPEAAGRFAGIAAENDTRSTT